MKIRITTILILLLSLLLLLILTNGQSPPSPPTPTPQPSSSALPSTISVLSGFKDHLKETVDDCCCEITMIDKANLDLNSVLNKIVKTRFFKYFRVNLFSECPFWVVTTLCGMDGGCGVCECDDNEIPLPWRIEDHSISDRVNIAPPPQGFTRWKDRKEDMWVIPYGPDSDTSYVNLDDTPESYTGYDGSSVWRSIYNENCFTRPLEDMCFEERVFYKLISGLHASITTHLSHNYEVDKKSGQWNPNPALFKNRFEHYPDRIDNLYFTFLFVLRSVGKIGPFLKEYSFNTGSDIDDRNTYELAQQLLKTNLMCNPSFDETLLFKDTYDKANLISQFKGHFQNISSILDCVTCEKCKLYGKMQTLGLGTALKILFDEDQSSLQRNEIIALINTLRQLSNSITFIKTLTQDSDFDIHHHYHPSSSLPNKSDRKKEEEKEDEVYQEKINDKDDDEEEVVSQNLGPSSPSWNQILLKNKYIKSIYKWVTDKTEQMTRSQVILLLLMTLMSVALIMNPLPKPPKKKKKKQNQNINNTDNIQVDSSDTNSSSSSSSSSNSNNNTYKKKKKNNNNHNLTSGGEKQHQKKNKQ